MHILNIGTGKWNVKYIYQLTEFNSLEVINVRIKIKHQ